MTTDTAPVTPAPETPGRKRRGIGRKILWAVGILFGLLVIAVVLFFLLIDGIIRTKVVEAATNATGQKTTLDSAVLRTFAGSLTLSKLNVANPQGFSTGGVIDLGQCSVSVNTGSLLGNTIEVPEVKLENLTISIEQQNIKNNLMEIINYIQSQRGQPTGEPAPAPQAAPVDPNAGKGRDLKIGVIRIIKPTLRFDLMGIKQTFALDDIEIKEPLNPDGRLPKLMDIIGKVLLQMADQALHNPRIPPQITSLLSGNLGKLDKIINADRLKDFVKIGDQIKMPNVEQFGKMGQDVQKNLQDAGKSVENLGKDLLRNPLDNKKK